ncbi:thioredoxin domain-containing protein [Acrasis kona]|uniref:Thioredoxin domain-containing protein n=1 Tax=Acrasis kona TaxID=1008807 RepID=A0AAW2ZK79_9EUKA
MKLLVVLFLAIVGVVVAKSHHPKDRIEGLVEFTRESFSKAVAEGDVFVEVYADWCGNCQNAIPTMRHLGDKVDQIAKGVTIGKINGEKYKEFGNGRKFSAVNGYPTLIYVRKGTEKKDNAREYKGSMNSNDIVRWVNRQRRD